MDRAFLIAFSITLLAGLSTVFGSFIVLFNKSKKTSWLSFSMSFAAGVMLYISFVEIIPDSIHVFSDQNATFFISNAYLNFGLFFLSGCALALFLEKVLPDHKISEKIGSGILSKEKYIELVYSLPYHWLFIIFLKVSSHLWNVTPICSLDWL